MIPFHAQGTGDAAMEELLEQGLFDGIVDIVPAGVLEEIVGGNRAAGPTRLEAAGKVGIPQVIAPCGLDMLSVGPLGRKDKDDPVWKARRLAERKMFIPDEFRVQIRSSADEAKEAAIAIAEKLNNAKGPVKFFIRTKGWSSISVEGTALYEPESDAALAPTLRSHLNDASIVKEMDTELPSPDFADALVAALEEMIKK